MEYTGYEFLNVTIPEERVLEISLNDPRHLNALNKKMIAELLDITTKLVGDHDYSVVIITGEGEKGFCGGLDVDGVFTPECFSSVDTFYQAQYDLGNIMINLRKMPQVVIAACFGWCVGGGLTIPSAADIRIATADVKFGGPFVKIKMGGADLGTSYFLWRQIGSGVAADMLLTGRNLEGEEADKLGFVTDGLQENAEAVKAAARKKAHGIAKTDPTILQLTKEALNINLDMAGLENAVLLEHRNQQMIISKLWRKDDGSVIYGKE